MSQASHSTLISSWVLYLPGQLAWPCPTCHPLRDRGARRACATAWKVCMLKAKAKRTGALRNLCRLFLCPQEEALVEKFLLVFLDPMLGPAAALSFLNKQGRKWLMVSSVLFWRLQGPIWQDNGHPTRPRSAWSLFWLWDVGSCWPQLLASKNSGCVLQEVTPWLWGPVWGQRLDFHPVSLRMKASTCKISFWLHVKWFRNQESD